MKTIRLCILLFLFGITTNGISQNASEKIDVNTHIDLVKVYEKYVEEGYGSPEIYEELANGYYFKNNYLLAKKWFEKLFESKEKIDPTAQFRYKQTIRALQVAHEEVENFVTSNK